MLEKRIAIIGGSGSGKSIFLCGMVQSLLTSTCNIPMPNGMIIHFNLHMDYYKETISDTGSYFAPEASIKEIIHDSIMDSELMDKYSVSGGFMDNTALMTEFGMTLKCEGRDLMKVSITDYPGELIDKPHNEEYEDMYDSLCSQLAECDALIVIADSTRIAMDYGYDLRMKEALKVNRVNALYGVLSKSKKTRSTVIALTKSDHHKVPDNMRDNGFAAVCNMLRNNIYSVIYTTIVGNGINNHIGMIPVTAVGDNMTDKNNNIVNPAVQAHNIDKAVLFCLYPFIADACRTMIAEYDSRITPLGLSVGEERRQRKENNQNIEAMKKFYTGLLNHNAYIYKAITDEMKEIYPQAAFLTGTSH